jgi:hypothetical protein
MTGGDWSRFLSSTPRPSLPSLSKKDDEDDKETQRCGWGWCEGGILLPWSRYVAHVYPLSLSPPLQTTAGAAGGWPLQHVQHQ